MGKLPKTRSSLTVVDEGIQDGSSKYGVNIDFCFSLETKDKLPNFNLFPELAYNGK